MASGEDNLATFKKWLLVDFAYCAILTQLRIPRLNYSKAVVLLQLSLLFFLDGLMFGAISVNMPGRSESGTSSPRFTSESWDSQRIGFLDLGFIFLDRPDLSAVPEPFSAVGFLASLSFGLLSSSSGAKDAHLLGQHTVRMSPISTAQLNPNGLTFCLTPPANAVLIPILLNNTNIHGLRYSVTPLGYTEDGTQGKIQYVDITAKDLKAIEQSRLESLQVIRPSAAVTRDSEEYDEYDDEDTYETPSTQSALQKTQSIVHIRLARSGTIRLERVFDPSNVDARLANPSEVTVVPCPQVQFVDDTSPDQDVRCAGEDPDLKLMIDIYGVPPLSLRWSASVNGRREQFLVEGIEGGHERDQKYSTDGDSIDGKGLVRRDGVPQDLRIPLVVSLDMVGSYLYTLQEVVDSVGNVVRVSPDHLPVDSELPGKTTTTRSFAVLRRPTISFKHCGPGTPTSLLIGSEAPLTISANEADSSDAPWEVLLQYQPPVESDEGVKGSKRFKSWKKTLKTQNNRRELVVRASAPGDYTILEVKGKVRPAKGLLFNLSKLFGFSGVQAMY